MSEFEKDVIIYSKKIAIASFIIGILIFLVFLLFSLEALAYLGVLFVLFTTGKIILGVTRSVLKMLIP